MYTACKHVNRSTIGGGLRAREEDPARKNDDLFLFRFSEDIFYFLINERRRRGGIYIIIK